jgi:hypothetical protein
MIRYLIALLVLVPALSAAPVPAAAANQVVAQWTTEDVDVGGTVTHHLWILDGNLKYNEVDPYDGSLISFATMKASRAKCLAPNQVTLPGGAVDFTIDVVTKGNDVVTTIGKGPQKRADRMVVDFIIPVISGDNQQTVLSRLHSILHVGTC